MASYQYIYVMKGVTKTFTNGKTVLNNIHLSFYPDAKIGILGPNGSGKSTLMKIMAGMDSDFSGEAFAADGTTVGYLPQEPNLDENLTVEQNVLSGLGEIKQTVDRFDEVSNLLGEVEDPDEMQKLIDEQAELQDKIEAEDAWDLSRRVEIAMDALRCPLGDADVSKLSGGERRRVALCRLLMQKPDLLLLDEPTNHLDAESIAWLQQHLVEYPGAVILVTHDRYFLDSVTGWILELDRGNGIPYEGNYSSWLEQKQKRIAQEGNDETGRQRTLARELEWIRSSPKARQTKSKARITAYESLLSKTQDKATGTAQIIIPTPPRLGNLVVECDHVKKGYGDRLLVEDMNFNLPPGGIVGIIGANGAGKTTLFRMMTESEKPDEGTLRMGETVKLGYVDQSRAALNPAHNVWEEISDGNDIIDLGSREIQSRSYVASFGFKGPDQQKNVGKLSGGERNRVHMAKMLKSGANVLLLDEPSNDLDIETLRALEDALIEFAGCVVVISHDRWFLDRIATHILAFEGDSQVVWFEGNYQDYEADRHRRFGTDADTPHRIKYKPLER